MIGDPWCDGAAACGVLGLLALLVVGSGWVDGTTFALVMLLGVLVGGLLGLGALKLLGDGSTEPTTRKARSPEETLRQRYARNEITRAEYLRVLEDILKDRYVRGELDVDEYEARLDQLLHGPRAARSG